MADDVQVVYSADVDVFLAGNEAAAASVEETAAQMTEAVDSMAAASAAATASVSEVGEALAESMAAVTEASAGLVSAGEDVEAQMAAMAEADAALEAQFISTASTMADLIAERDADSASMAEAVANMDILEAAYLQVAAAQVEANAANASVRESYAANAAAGEASIEVLQGIVEAEQRATSATEQLALAKRNLAETEEYVAGAEGEAIVEVTALTQAMEREISLAGYAATAENAHAAATRAMGAAHSHAVPEVAAASGAIRELEGALPIRAVERFAVNVLGLGPILQAAFPLIGLIAVGEIFFEMGEKLHKVYEEAENAGAAIETAWSAANNELQLTNDNLAKTNDGLQKTLDKLQGNVHNTLWDLLDEDRIGADKLADSLTKAHGKALELISEKNQIGFWGSLFSGKAETKGVVEQVKGVFNSIQKVSDDYQADQDAAAERGEDHNVVKLKNDEMVPLVQVYADGTKKITEQLRILEDAQYDYANKGGAAFGMKDMTAQINILRGALKQLGEQQRQVGEEYRNTQLTTAVTQAQADQPKKAPSDKPKQAPSDKSGEEVQKYQEELNAKKIADDQYHEISTADEIAFWEQKKALWKDGTNAYREIVAKLAELYKSQSNEQKKAAEEEYRAKIAAEELKLAAVQKGSKAAIAIRHEEEVLAIAFYGAESKQAMEAAAQRVKAENEAADAILEAKARAAKAGGSREQADTSDDAQRQLTITKALADAGLTTQKAASQAELAIIAARDAALLASAEKELAILQLLALANGKFDKDVEEAQKRLDALKRKSDDDELNASLTNLQRQAAVYNNFFAELNKGFKSSIDGWLKGSESFGLGMERTFQGMARSMVENLAEMGMKWAEHEALKVLLTSAGQQAQTLATATGAAERKTINATTALSEANTNAMKAATGAYAATVDIPIVGPVLAPIAAATAYTAVMGLTALASASGGWGQIPNDQLAMVHKNEMILPANIAQNVRDMSGGAGATGDTHIHLGGNSYSALGSGAMRGLLQGSQRELVSTMKSAIRDGKMRNP
jgi:hypothetical protein